MNSVEESRLKRKIAVIMAADVVGYSRLVARDEDGALRRLMDYRRIFDDFVTRGHGRIFNTAGDAVLAEFDSAVEAIRAAMDIQEALKSRNAELTEDRRMIFRIGVSLGDVVQREGDLLGDGVNIAARLQALAAPGGICVSHAVHEQVADKIAIVFRDIGQQSVKNIPRPVHAYMIGDEPPGLIAPKAGQPQVPRAHSPTHRPLALMTMTLAVALVAAAGGAWFWHIAHRSLRARPAEQAASQPQTQAPSQPQPAFATAAAGRTVPAPAAQPDPAAARNPLRQSLAGTPLRPSDIPFIPRYSQQVVERFYMTQTGPKALAIALGAFGMSRGATDEGAAKAQALGQCEERSLAAGHCTIFAVGDTVVWDHPQPPMPADGPLAPRFVRIAAADENSVPFMGDDRHKQGLDAYLKLPTPKALAVGPGTALEYVYGGNSSHDVVRRALQICGDRARAPCLLVAVDNDAVTRVPQSMRTTGLLETDGMVPMPEALRQQLLSVSDTAPWYALATSAGGKFAIGTSKSTEGEAVDAALASCRSNGEVGCAIAAIGPYRVRPKMAASP